MSPKISAVIERLTKIDDDERAALESLIKIAKSDTGQSRKVADFLLAWWNSANCGGFDLTTLWGVDAEIAADMITVFAMIARVHCYADAWGYRQDFERIVELWRPELVKPH